MSRPMESYKKTERTHEENQERYHNPIFHVIKSVLTSIFNRAYIAASRRSDRSLEARLESARRASEIHKRRTGKALRVTEADVQNEEMYEEEDDMPAGFAYGYGSSSLDMRMRMQAYWEHQFALRNAMSLAAAGGNLNASNNQTSLSLRDYYQRFAQQYPLSLTSNQYFFPSAQIPTNPQPTTTLAPPVVLEPPKSPSLDSTPSTSPTKSPVIVNSQRTSVSTAPYSATNSQRNRRLSSNVTSEQPSQNRRPSSIANIGYTNPQLTEDVFATQSSYQPLMAPFTTQLPTHMQQYHLPDFVNPSPNIPVQSIPLDKFATDDSTDIFSSNDWTSFLGQPQVPSKITSYEDGTNWDDYLDGDAN